MTSSEIVKRPDLSFRAKVHRIPQLLIANKISLLLYLLSSIATVAVFLFVTQAYRFSWRLPFAYSGDALFNLVIFKGLMNGEWSPFDIVHSSFLAAPFEFNTGDFPMTDRLNFLLMKWLAVGAHDPNLAYNLFFLMTSVLCSWSALFVLRRFKIHSGLALVFGVLFSALPFHFFRLSHIGVAAYFLVPLQILVTVWIWQRKPLFFKKASGSYFLSIQDRRDKLTLATLILSGVSFFYYAFFFCIFCGLSGIGAAIYRKSRVHLLSSFLCCTLVCSSFFISLLPNKIYVASQGLNHEVASRATIESEVFAMKLTNILLPIPEHRLQIFKNLRARYESATPSVEGTNESIGILGAIGFLISFFSIYLLRTTSLMKKLAALQMTAVLFGTIGGFGSLFALLGNPTVRSYNRISIFIAFISLAVLALTLESLRRWIINRVEVWNLNSNIAKSAYYVGVLLILFVGLFDQTSDNMRIQPNTEEFQSDHDFIEKIEQKSVSGAMILQLPYLPFPENGSILRMEDYSHFKGYLHSTSLRWSYGTMRGRQEDLLTRRLGAYPPDLAEIKKDGFSGIYIDRYGYPDDAAMLEARLAHELNQQPIVSRNGRLSFFSLKD